ncbi:hypothetical protein [Mycobacterium sp.]|uniref:hypothetical protein n=1 Tax=Mycobacterium sp. TaxID=1785 RepID=UPI003C74C9F0
MLSPYDDFPIHPSADPIAHPASADPNHYDRYWFNGHDREGQFIFGAAMGHYPVRGVIDAAFSIVVDGVQHSVFSSGVMPTDRSTVVGPIHIEVLDPMRRVRFVVGPNEHGITADLTFTAATVAIEEPRQRRLSPEGIVLTDHTRLTQWGAWAGVITVDSTRIAIHPDRVPGTRDRSWGVRPVGEQIATNRAFQIPQVFWLWAPLHFGDYYTHLALHENADGSRWLQTALVLEPVGPDVAPWSRAGVRECGGIAYQIEWQPGRREMRSARLSFDDPVDGHMVIDLEKITTFRMRGIGYMHPYWNHGSNHGQAETGRESIGIDDFEPLELSSIHIQNLVRARLGQRVGIGVLEQFHMGEHQPTGLTGFLDGYRA